MKNRTSAEKTPTSGNSFWRPILKDKRIKGIKTVTEYVIQIKEKDGYRDYSIYNRRTCLWKKPIEEWPSEIIAGYEYKRCCEKHRSTRLVKRITIEEIICKGVVK